MEKYKRNAVYSLLEKFESHEKKGAYIEVVEWANGIGFDVEINGHKPERFRISYNEFKALKMLVQKLNEPKAEGS